MRALTLAGSVLLVMCAATACSEKTKQETRDAGRQTAEAAQAAGQAAESAAQDAVNNAEGAVDAVQAGRRTEEAEASVKRAGRAAREKVNEAADAAAAAVQTAQVKGALVADSSVDAKGIHVNTDAHVKTITLKGHVPSAAQKTAAGRIAKEKASTGYTVHNQLAVRP